MASKMALDMLSDRDELTSTVALLMRAWHSAGASVEHTRTPLSLGRKKWRNTYWRVLGEITEGGAAEERGERFPEGLEGRKEKCQEKIGNSILGLVQ